MSAPGHLGCDLRSQRPPEQGRVPCWPVPFASALPRTVLQTWEVVEPRDGGPVWGI